MPPCMREDTDPRRSLGGVKQLMVEAFLYAKGDPRINFQNLMTASVKYFCEIEKAFISLEDYFLNLQIRIKIEILRRLFVNSL